MQKQSEDADFNPSKLAVRGKYRKNRKWTQTQNLRYISFLKQSAEDYAEGRYQNKTKYFQEMARFMKSRNVAQCRSHDQKMHEKFKTIDQMIDYHHKNEGISVKIEEQSEKIVQYQSFITQSTEYYEGTHHSTQILPNYFLPYGLFPMPFINIPKQQIAQECQVKKQEE